MAASALPPYKYAVNLPVARGTVNMQSIGLAALYGAPSGDLEAPNNIFKEASQLRGIFGGPLIFQTFAKETLGSSLVFLSFWSRWPRDLIKIM